MKRKSLLECASAVLDQMQADGHDVHCLNQIRCIVNFCKGENNCRKCDTCCLKSFIKKLNGKIENEPLEALIKEIDKKLED